MINAGSFSERLLMIEKKICFAWKPIGPAFRFILNRLKIEFEKTNCRFIQPKSCFLYYAIGFACHWILFGQG